MSALISDKNAVVAQLSNISPITLDKISVDEYGAVIVSDTGFQSKIISKAQADVARPR